MDIYEWIFEKTTREYQKFCTKYHTKPKYIKMPLWCVSELERKTREMFMWYIPSERDDTEKTFLGMKICETISIENIEEIEVF